MAATRRRRPRLQQCVKRLYGRCLLCGEARYEALQCHRVVPGANNGVYREGNVVVLCANCHSLVTAGVVKVHAIHPSTFAQFVVHYTDADGNEHWKPMRPA